MLTRRRRSSTYNGMKLNLKVEWIRKMKGSSIVEDHRWCSPDQWRAVDIESLEDRDLDQLLELMEKHKDVKGSVAVKQKIVTYRKLLVDVKGVKISRLEPLVLAVKKLLEPTPHKWLFIENEDGYLVPWYVYNVDYNPPDERNGAPAHTDVSLSVGVPVVPLQLLKIGIVYKSNLALR